VWYPSVICGEERQKPFGGVLITETNMRTLSQTCTFIFKGDLTDQLQTAGVFFQDLFEVWIILALKFNLEASLKPHLEPNVVIMNLY